MVVHQGRAALRLALHRHVERSPCRAAPGRSVCSPWQSSAAARFSCARIVRLLPPIVRLETGEDLVVGAPAYLRMSKLTRLPTSPFVPRPCPPCGALGVTSSSMGSDEQPDRLAWAKCVPPIKKRPIFRLGVFGSRSLTMSYFHTGIRTIIGAEAFHGPVRDGKEWGHLAMVIRHNLLS